jgi:hypothetical protein
MYLRYKSGNIAYPYSPRNLRKDNPHVSFPETIPEEVLADWSVFPVIDVPAPEVTYQQNLAEGTPTLLEDRWYRTWIVSDATPTEIAARTASQAGEVRARRNKLLTTSDWTQLPDALGDRYAWQAYRKALRGLTSQPGFPWEVEWPTPPA